MKISQRAQSVAPFFAMEFGKRAAALEAQGIDVIKLSLGEPDFGPPPAVLEAARTISRRLALSNAYGHHGLGKLLPRRETALPACAPPHDEEVLT